MDEAAQDPEFVAFREALLGIVAKRDTTSLFALLNPLIKASHGGDEGLDGFRAVFRPADADTELWTVLEDVLRHGGRFQGADRFLAPWTAALPYDSIDAFDHAIVRDRDVPVRAAPDSTAPELARLSYAIVAYAPLDVSPDWYRVALVGGGDGVVAARHLRSPIGYRITFERVDGRWHILYFLQGD